MLENYSFQHLVSKGELKADLAQMEESLLWSPGFSGSSSISQHFTGRVVANLMRGPEAVELEEHGSGLELVNANLLCHAANMPWGSVVRSGSFGMRRSMCWTWPLAAAPLPGLCVQLAPSSSGSARPALGFRRVNSFAACFFKFCYHVKIKHLSK